MKTWLVRRWEQTKIALMCLGGIALLIFLVVLIGGGSLSYAVAVAGFTVGAFALAGLIFGT